ncbi:PHP-like protein [Bacteroidia bacterium]|nr:PHP-like protein [Bacteroidia bacterium]
MKTIDLHIHTTYSDGSFTPTEIVQYANNKGLSAIAITDHDSISGVEEAIIAGNQLNIEVISGIEISTEFDIFNGNKPPISVHLLGLFVDFRDSNLVRILEMRRNAQIIRNQERIKRLIDLGFDVSYEELLSYTKMQTPTKFYISQYLASKGISEAKELLGVGGAAYIESTFKQPFAESIGLIHQAGGLAILAHPILCRISISALEKMIILMKDLGLDGIETYHSNNTPYTSRCMVDLANTYHLCKSGGSDFHGTNIPEIDLGTCIEGNSRVPYSILEDLHKHNLERSRK